MASISNRASRDNPRLTQASLTVALAGNPNCGKTTLFNALTGLKQKIANYPGVTVERKSGRAMLPDGRVAGIIDLPGAYSLISLSPDELVAMEVLRGVRADTPRPDVIVAVVDASNLQRNLYLVSQIVELGRPIAVALSMMDIARRRGIRLSPERLSQQLGVPVVPVVGHRRDGIEALRQAIVDARIPNPPAIPRSEPMQWAIQRVAESIALAKAEEDAPAFSPATVSGKNPSISDVLAGHILALGVDAHSGATSDRLAGNGATSAAPADPESVSGDASAGAWRRYAVIAERLLVDDHSADAARLIAIPAVAASVDEVKRELAEAGADPVQADVESRYEWIEQIAAASLEPACIAIASGLASMQSDAASLGSSDASSAGGGNRSDPTGSPADVSGRPPSNGSSLARNAGQLIGSAASASTLTDSQPTTHTERIDRVLMHRFWGLTVFGLVMAALFVSVFWIADPLMGAAESGVAWLGELVTGRMSSGPLRDLVADGIFAGVGGMVVFVPQVAMLFLFLAILEDSGYLARAAFLMDRVLSGVGLHGKSFVPLLSSFACAIPGILATRTIETRQDRLATIFVAPFMSCSARLPVYFLLIGALFPSLGVWGRAGMMLSLYLLGILAAVATAMVFKRTMQRRHSPMFLMEMPSYKLPQPGQVLRQMWRGAWEFLRRAGTIIFFLSVVLWALMYYPRLSPERVDEIADQAAATFVVSTDVAEPSDGTAADVDAGLADATGGADAVMEARGAYLEQAIAGEQLRHSFAGRFGQLIEPVIRPLGYDWKMGVGLVGAFGAREVFVSTLGIAYSVGGDDEQTTPLREAMLADRYADGRHVWTPLVAASLLVWFVLAMQCISTLAVVRRETGGWSWPIGMLVYMNVLAYVVAFAVYQGGRLFGLQ